MSWRGILVLVVVIIILAAAGPANVAAFISGIGSWVATFINSL